jgi:hypothetical protein
LLSRSNLYLHHASHDMKSPRSMFTPPYQSHTRFHWLLLLL